MMLNVGALVIDPLLSQPFTVFRYGGGYLVESEGEFFAGQAEKIEMVGSIQPATQANLIKYGVEGLRSSEAIKLYTPDPLVLGDTDGNISDVILYKGLTYRIAYTRAWEDFGYSFSIAGRCRDV